MRRAVITGVGAVTPIGVGVDQLWAGLLAAKSGIVPITRFNAEQFSSKIAGEVRGDFEVAPTDARVERRLDRCSRFALRAAQDAVKDSNLALGTLDLSRAGVCVGSALGGASFAEEQHTRYLKSGIRNVAPALAIQMYVGAAGCQIAIAMGLTGYNCANADSCASGAIAIGNALRAIRRCDADVMLCGGAEAPLSPLCFGAFDHIGALSRRNAAPTIASRPFDADRDGFVMAEGAAVLVVEEMEHARRRGASIYAELCGFGVTNDAWHMTAPRPDAICSARSMSLALLDSGLQTTDISYVNAHGSSTLLNDPNESLAIRIALGAGADSVAVSGTKGLHGHALGATGAIEAAILALAINRGFVPGTANLVRPGHGCDLQYVTGQGREMVVHAALSNSFGFGGINACLAFRSV